MEINLFYHYSKIFLYISIVILLISLIRLLYTIIKTIKFSQPLINKVNNLAHNMDVTQRKFQNAKAILDKTFGILNNVLKYGFLAKIIFKDYHQSENKSVKTLAKITRNQISLNRQQELFQRLAKK